MKKERGMPKGSRHGENCKDYTRKPPTLQDSIVSENETKHFSEYYKDFWTGEKHFRTPEQIINIGAKLLAWLKGHPEALTIEEFTEDYGITSRAYYNFVDKYEELKEFHLTAIELLANRRERGINYIKYGMREKPLMFVHHRYRQAWKEAEEFHAGLQSKIAAASKGDITVKMMQAEETDEVKEKKLKDENRDRNQIKQISIPRLPETSS